MASMDSHWLRDLNRHSCVLVPTRGLQSELASRVAAQNIKAGQQVWESANIMTWPDFLALHWRKNLSQFRSIQHLLSAPQALILWERVIEQSRRKDEELTLLNVHQTARAAQRSWQLAHDWQIDWSSLASSAIQDSAQFSEWCNQYTDLLESRSLFDQISLYEALLGLGRSNQLQTPFQRVIWFGFDLITSAQQRWQQAFEQTSVKHHVEMLQDRAPETLFQSYPSTRAELYSVLTKARQHLEQNRDHTVRVVVPNLAHQRREVEAAAADVFYDGQTPLDLQNNNKVYRFSLGRPLPQWPAVTAALECIRSLNGPIAGTNLLWLLRNRHLQLATLGNGDRLSLIEYPTGLRLNVSISFFL